MYAGGGRQAGRVKMYRTGRSVRLGRRSSTAAAALDTLFLGGRLEIIADFGDQWLTFAEPGTEAA
jgi:hypothetical protein